MAILTNYRARLPSRKAPIEKRYSSGFLKDKQLVPVEKGSRAEILKKERKIVEKNPGPLNKEPWAGRQSN